MSKPKISVVISVYNGEKYIKEAVESILNQTFSDFELIIVNDASTDKTPQIIESYAKKDLRIKVIHNENNLRIAKSLNKAVSCAQADVIARMDGDDISLPERFEKQYALLQSDKKMGVVGCNMITIDKDGNEQGRRRYSTDSEFLKQSIFRYSPFPHPATMIKKKFFLKIGGYNHYLVPTEDIDLWIRLGKICDFSNVDEYLFKYRVLESSASHARLIRLELKTIFVRMYAVVYHGYTPTFMDILYNIGEFITMFLMPSKIRYKLFNFLRSHSLI